MCVLTDDRCCLWVKNAFFLAPDDLALESLTVQTVLKGTAAPWGQIFHGAS